MRKYKEKYFHERNYGCRIKEYVYKGLQTITMENELIKVSLLVDKGTDIFEFVYKPKDIDFMWHSFNGIKSRETYVPTKEHPRGTFFDYYEGGWQEIFPNIGEDCVYEGAPLGVHGEVCQTKWDYSIINDKPEEISIRFFIRTARTPFYLEKTLTLKTEDSSLYIREKVKNEGFIDMQFMWGHHPAFGPIFLDENCVIEMPEKNQAKTNWVKVSENMILPTDTSFNWPYIDDLDGNRWDLSRVSPIDASIIHMYYLYNIDKGWYRITNTNHKLAFELQWDKDIFPIIWVWAPYGGLKQYPWFGRNYNLAIEPLSALPNKLDEVANEDKAFKLSPGEEIETCLKACAIDFT